MFKTKAEKKAFRVGCSVGYKKAKTNSRKNSKFNKPKKNKQDVYFLQQEGNRPLTLFQRHNILMRDSDDYKDFYSFISREYPDLDCSERLKKIYSLYKKNL